MSAPVTVIKIGGSTLGSEGLLLRELAGLQQEGEPLVIIHGGGKEITRRLDEAGITEEFVDGLRRTGEAAIILVAEALDHVNTTICAALTAEGADIRPFRSDNCVLEAKKIPALGRVGEVTAVHANPLRDAVEARLLPVAAPLARDPTISSLLNVNADTAAGEVAISLGARRLIFATDVNGVRSRDGELLPLLHIDDAALLLADGTAAGGMAPKLQASMRAAGAGIESVILDARTPGSVTRLVRQGHAEGTRVGARTLA